MEFTGERFTTDCVREIWYEHWHRYAFACQLVQGKRVLDLACGEGYGSHLLASRASKVIGIDNASEAIAHASTKYVENNLEYRLGDATQIELADASVDVVVCFETLEHLGEQSQMLAEFRRVLTPEGLLVISTPDRRVYSDDAGFDNEFHVKELYKHEFEALLRQEFTAHRLYGQKLLFQSAIWIEDGSNAASAATEKSGKIEAGMRYEPVYWIALASQSEVYLPSIASSHWFGDHAESVYQHYYHEIRKNMQAGTLLAEQQRQIDLLEARSKMPWWRRLLNRNE